jgi:hypothetical protein
MAEYNNMMQSWMGSGKLDSKGREIGFVVGLNDNGEQYAAWVQSGRMIGRDFSDFGVPQRAKYFKTQAEATNWAYSTAKQRIANLK